MKRDEYPVWARRAAQWSADYFSTIRDRPVRAQTAPGDIAALLPEEPPEQPVDMETIFADFERIVPGGMTHWQSPRFFAYFPANAAPVSMVAEQLANSMAAQCMLWQTSPAATEMETCMVDWMRQALGLPEGFQGVIHDTATTANLAAVLTMRERALDWRGNESGTASEGQLRVYASDQTHSSVDKAVRIAGIGQQHLVKVPTDSAWALDPAALKRAIEADRAAGFTPAGLVLCVGGTSIGASDRLRESIAVARSENLYVHVDAAWAGNALVLPETRWMIDGVELVDSFVFNPHKWMFTNFDCSAFYIRDPREFVRVFDIMPEYLKTREDAAVTNYRDWGIALGRRFRALKLWFVIRNHGVEGLQRLIRSHIEMARRLAEDIDATGDFEVLRRPKLSLLCFRYHPEGADEPALDELNERLLYAANDSGKLYVTHTRMHGKYAIRFVVGQTGTEPRHVDAAWGMIQEIARSLARR